ncbi:MAG TPA: BTAD domain-containing putative transcriptional regulator [Arsenicitalea sp.]|jgi:DNA-binding SARP family transcriptional activator|nr:BTAD domain-containing putative transcriptional regulator [Arsenicitalea sp.]
MLTSVPSGFYRVAAYILLAGRDRPVLRQRIGHLLWSESDPARAGADLRQVLARIRRYQAEHGFLFITATATTLSLSGDSNVFCDLAAFIEELRNPEVESSVRLCELYRGDLLESQASAGSEFEEWLFFQRSRLRDEFIDNISLAILPDSGLTAQERTFCARRLTEVDPCNEGAYRALMWGAAESGQLSKVRHLFDVCSRRLRDELGVDPDEETVELFLTLTHQSNSPGRTRADN